MLFENTSCYINWEMNISTTKTYVKFSSSVLKFDIQVK